MAKPKLTQEIKDRADAIVARFNAEELRNQPHAHYTTRYRGAHLYLGHDQQGKLQPVCRLTYTGDMQDWSFAIYRWSREAYDPDEWFFPGDEEVDGTIEGAMRAGLQAYPP